MAKLTTVTNPFDPINSRVISDIEHGKPIYSVVAGFYIYRDVVVSVNGQVIHDYEYIIQEDDHVGFLAVPEKGGKNILGTIAMIALAVAAPYAAGAIMGATAGMVSAGLYGGLSGALIFGGLQMGVMMVGGMLINSLLSPSMPSSSPTQSMDSSPTYGWDNVQNQSAEGIALPIVYGKTRITPPIISQYVETVDNKQYLNILYALNDGEIASVSDVMINDNPITYYNDVVVETRLGTLNQTLIPSFDNTRVDTGVGAKLSTTETIRQTSYNNVTGLKIVVSAPSGIYYANDKGGLDERTVDLVVKYRIVGSPTWVTIPDTSISGATTSTVRATFSADAIPSGQYEISIARTTEESTSTRTQDKVYFEGFTEVVYDDFTYPTTALMAIRALATDQLSGSMPKVSCVVDRGFGTSNPSVSAQNILSLVGADINQSLFDTWATYCTNENFKCNIVFDSEINVREALNIVGMLGRANIIQMGATYLPIIERAESLPVQRFLFTMGNIIRDSFREDYLPLADRSNAVEVTYFDETLDYEKQSVELYQHGFDESVDTTRKASVTLYGCTDRTQAVRHGRFLMNKNRYLTNTVSFEADVDAIACTIGDIIDVSHDVPQWGYSGRLLDTDVSDTWIDTNATLVNGTTATTSNTNYVLLDRELILIGGVEYGLAIRLHDDTKATVSIKPSYNITTDTLPIPTSLAVSKFDIYAFGETDRVTKLFRVISISRSSDQRRKISAIEYIPQVYDDTSDTIDIPNLSSLSTVSYLNATTDTEIDPSGKNINIINLYWGGQAIAWDIYQREAYTTTWKLIGNTQNTFFQIKDVMTGSYEFKVGDKTVSTSLSQIVIPLADVTNVVSYYQNGVMNIKWDAVIEQYRSPIQYEVRRGVSWANSEVLGVVGINSLQADTAGSYWVKAYFLGADGVAVYSTTEAGITISGDTLVKNVVATWDEYATGWTGTKTNVVVSSGNLVMPEGTASGSYEIPIGHIVSLSSAQLCRVSITYSAGGGTITLFDDIANIDTYPNIDGDTTGKWSVKPKIAISQDGTTYGEWQDYAIGDYVGKKFKAKLDITSSDPTLTVLVDGFKFTVDMPDRIDRGTITTATGGTSVTFSTPFQAVPNNQITIVNATAGDDIKLTSETTGGFTVQVLNGGVGVARTINYLSQGY